jgi:opacity protein-like surface antigen
MKNISTILAAAVAALTLTGGAYAADLGRSTKDASVTGTMVDSRPINWSGIYVGGFVGYGNSNHDVSAQKYECVEATSGENRECTGVNPLGAYTASEGESAFIDGLNSHGAFAGARVGADFQVNHWLVGAFGDYTFSQAEFNVGAGPASTGFRGSIEDGNSWVLGVRGGYLFGEEKRALLYGLAGFGQQDVSYHGSFDGESGSKDVTFSGWVLGAGGEYAINNLISIGIEYQHFFGGSENLLDERGTKNYCAGVIDDKMQSDKVMGRINFKVGPGLFSN